MKLKLITDAETEQLTLTEVKNHLRISSNDEDDLLNSLILSARLYSQRITRNLYGSQIWEYYIDIFQSEIDIPLSNTTIINSIKYKNNIGVVDTVSDTIYELYHNKILLKNGECYPSFNPYPINPITINFTCGKDAPEIIKQAMLMLIGLWYENREGVGNDKNIPFGITNLLNTDRVL